MRGDEQLRPLFCKVVNPAKQRKLTLWRQCRLWLIEQVEAIRAEALARQEAFPCARPSRAGTMWW